MITFKWEFLELFADGDNLTHVKYVLSGEDDVNTVKTEGEHKFKTGTVTKPLSEIVESDLKQWVEKDTTQNDVNLIKSNIENQLNSLKNSSKKVDFPWLAETFTLGN